VSAIDPERLARVESLILLSGAHPDEQEQVEDMCVMEAVVPSHRRIHALVE
jgi:hypothetical protein